MIFVTRFCVLTLALVALTLAIGCSDAGGSAGKPGEADETVRRIAIIQSGDFLVDIAATGIVIPDQEVEISSKASGEILEMPFEASDTVQQGDLLVRLDPEDEKREVRKKENTLRRAEAGLGKAEAQLTLARSNHKKALADAKNALGYSETRLEEIEARHGRQQRLHAEGLISDQEIEISRTQLSEARNLISLSKTTLEDAKIQEYQIRVKEHDFELAGVEVADARITLEEAQERLDDTEVKAPIDGVITIRRVEPGMVISSAMANVGGGTALLLLSDLSSLFVRAAVDEADIGGIQLEQIADIRADAYPGRSFEGRVSHIAPLGTAVSSIVSFDVEIEVLGEGIDWLRPGMTADVEIVTGRSEDTLWVQSEAVREDDEGSYVEVKVEESDPKIVRVEVGLSDGLRTEISGELESGEELLLPTLKAMSPWERGEEKARNSAPEAESE